MPLLRAGVLAAVPGIAHGFSGRTGGVSEGAHATLDLAASVAMAGAAVAENRRRLAAALGLPAGAWRACRQVHGALVVPAPARVGTAPPAADGLWTAARGRLLVALAADCMPLLLAARDGSHVAAVHAGWRGTVAGIATTAVRTLAAAGVAPAELCAALGPAIGPCCFAIGADVAAALRAAAPGCAAAVQRRGGAEFGDLWAVNTYLLRAAGLPAARIEALRVCTACAVGYYSHRRDAGRTGRQAGAIARLPPRRES